MDGQTGDRGKSTLAERLRNELIKYGVVSGYLFVSFSLLLLYDSTANGGGQATLSITMALIKSLVLGKFLLIGEALHTGSRANAHPLLMRVLWKSLAFLVVLLVFKALEEFIVGWFHDKSLAEISNEVLDRSWLENLAPVLIMLLILIPLISVSESYRQLGPEKFKALWLERPSANNP